MLSTYEIMLEVTRKCNLLCDHCLRGDAENISMSKEVIDRVFSTINFYSIIFTGGEVTLAKKQFEWIKEAILKYEPEIHQFYIVINGTQFPKWFEFFCLWLKEYCLYGEDSNVFISNDQFHPKPVHKLKEKLYKYNEIYNDSFFSMLNYINSKNIINMGRGISKKAIIIYCLKKDHLFNAEFYINVYGDIFPCCDLSYSVQRKKDLFIGTVFNENEVIMQNLLSLFSKAKSKILVTETNIKYV
jgi:hypothetical protein